MDVGGESLDGIPRGTAFRHAACRLNTAGPGSVRCVSRCPLSAPGIAAGAPRRMPPCRRHARSTRRRYLPECLGRGARDAAGAGGRLHARVAPLKGRDWRRVAAPAPTGRCSSQARVQRHPPLKSLLRAMHPRAGPRPPPRSNRNPGCAQRALSARCLDRQLAPAPPAQRQARLARINCVSPVISCP